jgi:prepilin-type N-terminal cleavage/methylation domain-containing protein
MIRKLQQLKAKKGFTLVELMVVIAIIGVLAAILIPLMANFIRNARISSHNSAAASMRNDITYFLSSQQERNAGYNSRTVLVFEVTYDGTGHTIVGGLNDDDWMGDPPWDPENTGSRYNSWTDALEAYIDDNHPDTPVGARYYVAIAYNSAHAAIYAANGEFGEAELVGDGTLLSDAQENGFIESVFGGIETSNDRNIVGSAGRIVGDGD